MSVATEDKTYTPTVGDFFYASWGYEQSNIDYFKVVGVTPSGKSVHLQKWSSACVESEGGYTRVVPGENPSTWVDWSACTNDMDHWDRDAAKVIRDAPVVIKRVDTRYGVRIAWKSFASLSLWDGQSKYETAPGYGH